ncbi:MAG: lytic transglycosylase domain-containing protein [Thermoanaerobaculia bacterium]
MTFVRRTALSLSLLAAIPAGVEFARPPAVEAELPPVPPTPPTSTPTLPIPTTTPVPPSLPSASVSPVRPASDFSPDAPLPSEYVRAADAARANGYSAAREVLAARLAGPEPERSRARVVLGLLAWEHDHAAEARQLLAAGAGPQALEDLRLFVLAAESSARGALAEARSTLETLLRNSPDSTLRTPALIDLADLANRGHAAKDALGFIDQARREHLTPVERERVDCQAWTIARATGDAGVARDAARRLLVSSPLAAARLDVTGVLVTQPQGDWRNFLSVDDLLERTAALLAVNIPQGALATLDAVPEANRGVDWNLLRARALIAAQRGAEALRALATVTGTTADEDAALELERSHAAADAAAVRRGRPALPAEERDRLHSAERSALRRAIDLPASAGLRAQAIRELYSDLDSSGDADATLALLHELARVAPADTLGARPLWERGWREYQGGNWSGAIGFWSELRDLYPAISFARSAQYWSARAFDKLGDKERARGAYLDLTQADTLDFYARQAVLRLPGRSQAFASAASGSGAGEPGGAPVARLETATPGDRRNEGRDKVRAKDDNGAREVWPEDPQLARARWLSDLALDKMALAELERRSSLAPAPSSTDNRASTALRGLILARTGDRRESLRALRTAFPRLATAHQETVPRVALDLFYPRAFAGDVTRLAGERSLPASLVFGIVHQESGFDPVAKSHAGARGLMQIMPATGRELAKRLGMTFSSQRLFEPEYSLRLGTTYFRQLMAMFDNRLELALAGYNGGPGRIQRLWREQPSNGEVDQFLEGLQPTESRNYVKRILVLAESYRSLYSDLS